jgi:hypothetical protein
VHLRLLVDIAALPIVLGVSDCAHAFGSSCSAFGATGGLVVGGACATAAVEIRIAAVAISKMRIPRIIARSLPRLTTRTD